MKQKILEIIEKELKEARTQRRFCYEHKFEIERMSYNKLCEKLDDIRFEIERLEKDEK